MVTSSSTLAIEPSAAGSPYEIKDPLWLSFPAVVGAELSVRYLSRQMSIETGGGDGTALPPQKSPNVGCDAVAWYGCQIQALRKWLFTQLDVLEYLDRDTGMRRDMN